MKEKENLLLNQNNFAPLWIHEIIYYRSGIIHRKTKKNFDWLHSLCEMVIEASQIMDNGSYNCSYLKHSLLVHQKKHNYLTAIKCSSAVIISALANLSLKEDLKLS